MRLEKGPDPAIRARSFWQKCELLEVQRPGALLGTSNSGAGGPKSLKSWNFLPRKSTKGEQEGDPRLAGLQLTVTSPLGQLRRFPGPETQGWLLAIEGSSAECPLRRR